MKNFKEQKLQVLAVLALAFSLGLVAPNAAVFASEEGAGTPVAQNAAEGGNQDGDGAGDKEEALKLDASIVELYNRIQTKDSFKGYRDAVTLIANTEKAESQLLISAEQWAKNIEIYPLSVWFTISSSATKTALQDKAVYESVEIFKNDNAYNTNAQYKATIDALEQEINTVVATERAQIEALNPDVKDVDEMNLKMLVNTAKRLKNYDKYKALYDSLQFTEDAVLNNDDTKLSLDKLHALYNEDQLVLSYNKMAVAANAIDDTVMTGLDASWKLPTTSAGEDDKKTDVTTPNTGIVGMIETGALDLATLTLIASVVVASIAGLGLIAKLYLKHKF